MRQALTLHPDSRCAAVTRIEVDVARPRPEALALTYLIAGRIEAIRLPPVAVPVRTDALWKHTCFEAFVRGAGAGFGEGYQEFNFAPSTQWAAYRFDGYRDGMRNADIAAPRIAVLADADSFTLHVDLDIGDLPSDAAWRLGISAIIEEANGDTSYWALAHAPGRADFHHPDSFALSLPVIDLSFTDPS